MKPRRQQPLLRTGTRAIFQDDKKIVLKGVNLGGWLMMEGYILHSLNNAEQVFKKDFARALGIEALHGFERDFRANFIRKKDLQRIAALGFNCVRVPFNYRLLETTPYKYDPQGVALLDKVIRWASEVRVWVILDMHAACGSQNHDWHSDSTGRADLWHQERARDRVAALWSFLARRYKDHPWVAGYDLINEAVTQDTALLNAFYRRLIKDIRQEDKGHIIFVEGNTWATDLACLDKFDDDNLAFSIHVYNPLDFTCNFVPHLRYPLRDAKSRRIVFSKQTMRSLVRYYSRFARSRGRPVLVGEFGVNCRQGVFGEDRWLQDVLECFSEAGFSWTYWTYKAVKNAIFPDGLFSYMANPPWVSRHGRRLGWDNYSSCWLEQRQAMVRSWQTEQFNENKELTAILRKAAQ